MLLCAMATVRELTKLVSTGAVGVLPLGARRHSLRAQLLNNRWWHPPGNTPRTCTTVERASKRCSSTIGAGCSGTRDTDNDPGILNTGSRQIKYGEINHRGANSQVWITAGAAAGHARRATLTPTPTATTHTTAFPPPSSSQEPDTMDASSAFAPKADVSGVVQQHTRGPFAREPRLQLLVSRVRHMLPAQPTCRAMT